MSVVAELAHAFANLAEVFNRNPFGAVIVLLLACVAVVGLMTLAFLRRNGAIRPAPPSDRARRPSRASPTAASR